MPALAARAPRGATKPATGVGDARMSRMMPRIAPSSPPGVSICRTRSCAPLARRLLQRTVDVIGGGRADGAVDAHHEHRRAGSPGGDRDQQQREHEQPLQAAVHVIGGRRAVCVHVDRRAGNGSPLPCRGAYTRSAGTAGTRDDPRQDRRRRRRRREVEASPDRNLQRLCGTARTPSPRPDRRSPTDVAAAPDFGRAVLLVRPK